MKSMQFVICAGLFTAMTSAANAATITFDDSAPSGSSFNYTDSGYSEAGFTVMSIGGSGVYTIDGGNPTAPNLTDYLDIQGGTGAFVLTENTGASFSLSGFNAAQIAQTSGSLSYQITVTGALSSGGTVTSQFVPWGAPQFSSVNWRSFVLPDTFVDLTSVTFAQTGTGNFTVYENISVEVSSIPVPAAAWLFGSGLLGLIGVARRKKVA
jgi:hypothetical protein